MSKHLERDLDDLQKDIMGLASLVEQAFSLSIIALRDRNPDIARDVIQGDVQIDTEENLYTRPQVKQTEDYITGRFG